MTSELTYSKRYESRWGDHKASFEQVLREDIFRKSWDRPFDLPAVPVEANLSHALACLYAGQRELAEPFLERAITYANELERQNQFHDTEVAECAYPCSLAEVLQARAYARWLLGQDLDRGTMKQAAQHFVDWCLTKPDDCRRFVSPVTMGFYLEGIRAAAVSGDIDFARKFVEAPHRFTDYHAEERDLWRSLLTSYPRLDQRFREQFEEFFDRVRNPDFQVTVGGYPTFVRREWLALDTGIIRQMYFVNASPLDTVDPQAVVDAVAY